MSGGRPTKYSREILDKLEDYIRNYSTYGDIVPTAAGFACVIEVSRGTLYNWADKHRPFLDMLGRLNAAQEKILIENGLIGQWNATIAKLMLAKQGYSDRVDSNIEVKDYRVVPPDESLLDADDD